MHPKWFTPSSATSNAPLTIQPSLRLHSRRQTLMALGALIAVPWQSSPAADTRSAIPNLHEAINRAGRQRMLSQRMAKAWLAMGQSVQPQQAGAILEASIALFERQLDELKAFAPTDKVLHTYVTLDPLWQRYKRTLLRGAPDRAHAEEVLALDAKVLGLAHEGTQQLEALAGKSTAALVNLSGRQRMLSQRAAKFYLSQSWGTANDQQRLALQQARTEFAHALQVLSEAQETTPAIRDDLALVAQQWVFFDNALARSGEADMGRLHAREVFASSEHILLMMDRITAQFSRLG